MKETEGDPLLARIGYIAATTGRPPRDIARHSEYELMFWEYWLRKVRADDEDRHWEKFGRQMGTTWYRADFEEREGGAKMDTNRIFYPHALLVSPNSLYKQIKQDFEQTKPRVAGGEYRAEKDEEIVETSQLSYEEFREFFSHFESGLGGGG